MLKQLKQQLVSSQAGQSMIEVIIVSVVVGTVLTALAASLTMSASNSSQNKKRSLATTYAQEGLELFRHQRSQLGWSRFVQGLINGQTYCLNTLPSDLEGLSADSCASGETIEDTGLSREAEVAITGSTQVEVVVTVFWFDDEEEKSVQVQQAFQDI